MITTIEEIRLRFADICDYEWATRPAPRGHGGDYVEVANMNGTLIAHVFNIDDADFIAHSPHDINTMLDSDTLYQQQLADVIRIAKEVLPDQVMTLAEHAAWAMNAEIVRLRAEVATEKRKLEAYADSVDDFYDDSNR